MPFTHLITRFHAALLVLIGSVLTIGGAWFIELVLGVKPCHLCLIGRIPHYIGMRIFGLSLASWNALISLGLAVVAAVGTLKANSE